MPAKQIIFDEEARVALKRGADTLADAVKSYPWSTRKKCSYPKIFRCPAGNL